MRGGQAPGWYRMTLGKFEITALSDGTIQAPVDRFLHGVPPAREKALLERAYLESPAHRRGRRGPLRPGAGQAGREPRGVGLRA